MNNIDLREEICKAFTTDMTLAGGAREMVIANFFLGMISVFATETLYLVPLFFISHGVIVALTKRDSKFFKAFFSHMKYKNYYY